MYCIENDALPKESQEVAEIIARIWTAFAHDEQPWEPYTKGERYIRFRPDEYVDLKQGKSDNTRQYRQVEWLKEHFEPLK